MDRPRRRLALAAAALALAVSLLPSAMALGAGRTGVTEVTKPIPTPPPGGSAGAPSLPGAPACPVFPLDNVWNVRIDARPVASDSATLINSIGLTRGLHMDFGSYAGYGIPYQVVSATTPRSSVTFDYASESDKVGYPIPSNPLVEGGSDRHILMVDKDACRLYELFNARKSGSA